MLGLKLLFLVCYVRPLAGMHRAGTGNTQKQWQHPSSDGQDPEDAEDDPPAQSCQSCSVSLYPHKSNIIFVVITT